MDQTPRVLKRYKDTVYERFWRRELDIEDEAVIAGAVGEAGGDRQGFPAFLNGEGRRGYDALQSQLHGAGVFGVPSYVIGGEVFFGREHLPAIRWLLGGRRGPAPDVAYDRFEPPP